MKFFSKKVGTGKSSVRKKVLFIPQKTGNPPHAGEQSPPEKFSDLEDKSALHGCLLIDPSDPFWKEVLQNNAAGRVTLEVTVSITGKNDNSTDCQDGMKVNGAPVLTTTYHPLTQQELVVMGLIAQGKRRSAIARQLSITVLTYDTHRRNIRRKLGAKSVVEMIDKAQMMGLLD